MRFFKRKDSSSDLLATDKITDVNENICLDYFATCGKLGKTITAGKRQIIKSVGNEINVLTTHELDKKINKDFIKESTLRKYNTDEKDFEIIGAEWYPRLRTIVINGDTTSIDSDDSDLLTDGFNEPFSWETRSLQEMDFPPTPELEKKTFEDTINQRNASKKKKRTTSGAENSSDLRSYETLEEMRERLKKNYEEAKYQREKHLNLKNEKTKEEIEEKSVNGYRGKKKNQNIFKNYKQQGNTQKNHDKSTSEDLSKLKRSNSKVRNPMIEIQQPPSNSNSFSAELSTALLKHGDNSASSLSTSTPRSTSTHSMKSDSEATSKNNRDLITNGDISIIATSTELTRRHSSRKKKSTSRSGSLRRKNSQKKTTTNNNNMSPVMRNSLTDIDGKQKLEKEQQDDDTKATEGTDGLSNVLDMLSNW